MESSITLELTLKLSVVMINYLGENYLIEAWLYSYFGIMCDFVILRVTFLLAYFGLFNFVQDKLTRRNSWMRMADRYWDLTDHAIFIFGLQVTCNGWGNCTCEGQCACFDNSPFTGATCEDCPVRKIS